jgi:hypothetical protein
MWPWGGPRVVKERLVERTQLNDRKTKKKGDPKNPSLASAELLDFIGPPHSSEELRLPLPPMPTGHDADINSYVDRQNLASVAARGDEGERGRLEQNLDNLRAAPERIDRLKALLSREGAMLKLISKVYDDVEEINRRRREEQKAEGF